MNTIISPNSGKKLGAAAEDTDSDIEAALGRASRATPIPAAERKRLLESWADRIVAAKEELAAIVVDEVGKLPSEAVGEVEYAAQFLRAAAAAIGTIEQTERRDGRTIALQPLGLALLLAPYNDPLAGLARKIGPAIAAGCSAIVKPSPLGHLSAEALSKLIYEPKRLEWLFLADHGAIKNLVRDERIDVVSFTGSTTVGRQIAAAAAAGPKKCILELGGNCLFIVLRDADLDLAVRDVVARKIRAAGQACSAVNRIYVESAVTDDFCNRLHAAIRGLSTGPSNQPDVQYGPVRTAEAQTRLAALKRRCIESGMNALACASDHSGSSGAFVVPLTVLAGPLLDEGRMNPLDFEEAFGPLMSVQSFIAEDHLVARLRSERHALAAYVYGAEPARLRRLVDALGFGSVGVNTIAIQAPDVPTGGCRAAGYGREGGIWGVLEFTTTKNIRGIG